jgi:hypothetical protein
MHDYSINSVADGVVRVNGREVARIQAGQRPYKIQSFETDLTPFAGRHAMIEFIADGLVLGPASADWHNPQIIAGGQ